MAAKIYADIKPTGLRQIDEVDLYYDIVSSIQGICHKMDDDGGVTLETYEANCYTAIFNGVIEDSKGNVIRNYITPTSSMVEPIFVSPRGIGDRERIDLLHMIVNMLKTLTKQCDTDNLTDNNFEALCYIATILYLVTSSKDSTLGNGTLYTFHTGAWSQKELIELLYGFVYSLNLLTAKLDADGTVTDTDYTALWYTANILLTVENGAGSRKGN